MGNDKGLWISIAAGFAILALSAIYIDPQHAAQNPNAFMQYFILPAIGLLGNAGAALVFALAAGFGLSRALGVPLPFGKTGASPAEDTAVVTPSRPRADPVPPARSGFGNAQRLAFAAASPVPQDLPPAEPRRTGTSFRVRAQAEFLAARHARGSVSRERMEESLRGCFGPDTVLEDEVYDRAQALIAEQQRQTTPHRQHVDPVALVRKPRERNRDWSQDRSHLGGLPRLGGLEWPRGADGRPLHFAAQVDLAELASVNPDTPLPKSGSLAFFLGGAGCVLHVTDPDAAATPAPSDLPHAFAEGGHPMPELPSAVTRPLFPFWPLQPVRLRLPDDLPEPSEQSDDMEAITQAQDAALRAAVPQQAYPYEKQDDPPALWWYAAHYVQSQLRDSLDYLPRAIALREKWISDALGYQARLAAEEEPDEAKIQQSREGEQRNRAAIPAIRAQAEGLEQFTAHFAAFAEGHDAWERMSPEAVEVLGEAMAQARDAFPELCTYRVPQMLSQLHTVCIKAMITGDAPAFAALPDDRLDRLNKGSRLPGGVPHQMFGVGGCVQGALYEHLCDHLLLQIGYDDLAEMGFGDMGVWQFWIAPEALAAGAFDKAELTFECS